MHNLVELFCLVDDFCKEFMPEFKKRLLEDTGKKYERPCKLSSSEVMALVIYFQQIRFRDFKTYYIQYVQRHLSQAFPKLVSYNRFLERMPSILIPLCVFLHCFYGQQRGIYFVDSTTIKVCHIKRASSNKVFKDTAKKSKSSMGWFFGFKLHIVINDQGELLAFKLTSATTDDRIPVEEMTQGLTGKLIGDKGYLSQKLFDILYQRGLKLITKIKSNMKNKLMPIADKILLRKRAVIESVNDQLKNISQIEHSRHRSVVNFMVNLIAGLIAYCLQPKKPSLHFYNAGLLAL